MDIEVHMVHYDAAERYERQLTQADLGLVGYPFAAYAPAPFPPPAPWTGES